MVSQCWLVDLSLLINLDQVILLILMGSDDILYLLEQLNNWFRDMTTDLLQKV